MRDYSSLWRPDTISKKARARFAPHSVNVRRVIYYWSVCLTKQILLPCWSSLALQICQHSPNISALINSVWPYRKFRLITLSQAAIENAFNCDYFVYLWIVLLSHSVYVALSLSLACWRKAHTCANMFMLDSILRVCVCAWVWARRTIIVRCRRNLWRFYYEPSAPTMTW